MLVEMIKELLWLFVPLMMLSAFAGLGIAFYTMFKGWYFNALAATNISVLSMCLCLSLKKYLGG
ncbi:hypothetical protein LCGC14_0548230 [marine sediment metagenome]|uniref:Uncharacterized protein n=1 Tax=marine sediment metagenome TaxID=412755 RepID=A0A0F9S9A0_9ZZZZ